MKIEWETPQYFFDEINKEFMFDVDVCAVKQNAKIPNFIDPHLNGLKISWHGNCWMNPPYDKTKRNWIAKAYNESQNGNLIVCLLQSIGTDTKWFHKYIMKSSEIRFIKGRIQFINNGKVGANSNISSMLVIFMPYCKGPPIISSIDRWGRSYIESSI